MVSYRGLLTMRDITIAKHLHDQLMKLAAFQLTKCGRCYNPDGTVTFPVSEEIYARLVSIHVDPAQALVILLEKEANGPSGVRHRLPPLRREG